jgi:hypothetical protein
MRERVGKTEVERWLNLKPGIREKPIRNTSISQGGREMQSSRRSDPKKRVSYRVLSSVTVMYGAAWPTSMSHYTLNTSFHGSRLILGTFSKTSFPST